MDKSKSYICSIDNILKDDDMEVSYPVPFNSVNGPMIGYVNCKIESSPPGGSGELNLDVPGAAENAIQACAEAIYCAVKKINHRYKQERGFSETYFESRKLSVSVPGPVSGVSLGLGVFCALMCAAFGKSKDLIPATGHLHETGHLHYVDGINEKIVAAKAAGYDSIIIPSANWNQVPDCLQEMIKIHPAVDLREVLVLLGLTSS